MLSDNQLLRPVRQQSRNDAVLDALAEFIASAQIKPGSKLPTERELTERLQVGRSTVREALKRWEALGIVETRKGSGTFLRMPVSPGDIHVPLTIQRQKKSLLQTLEIRRALETEASMLAAQRATKEELVRMEARLVAMEKVHLAQGSAGPEDWQFHLSIYEATGNPMFAQIVEHLRIPIYSFFDRPFDLKDFASRSFPIHRELFEAIAAGDAEDARNKTLAILAVTEADTRAVSYGR
ncbi:MAG: FadR/GntR family transcriptional regulator [Alphaproteobacteria bacterium]